MIVHRILECIGAIAVLLVWFVSCYTPTHAISVQPNPIIQAGFQRAVECFPTDTKLSDVHLAVVPGKDFEVLLSSTPIVGFGMYHRVYVVEAWEKDTATWAHEFIHAFGVVGHPKNIFDKCDL